jgi:signal transduction histidine kinase
LLLAVYVLLSAAVLVFAVLTRDSPAQGEAGNPYEILAWLAGALVFPVVGALIASRRAGGPIGWICLAVGLAIAATGLSERYAVYALVTEPGSLPAGEFAAYMGSWSWVVFIGLIGVFLILLFPDGKLPSPRWRWLAIAASGGMAAAIVAIMLGPGETEAPVPVENPIGIDAAQAPLTVLSWCGILTLFFSIIAAMAAAVLRFRRAGAEQRQQLKWFASAAVLTVAAFFSSLPAALVSDTLAHVLETLGVVAWVTLPIAIGIAILRYRLYDIDLVINKAVVFGVLAAFITAVYVGIVVGASALVGTAGEPNLALSIVATAVVAVAFQPARERVQRFANRLVYGRRATPYEVLAEFSEQAGATVAREDVLPNMARAVAEGTGAAQSEVWVRSGSELRLAASWPQARPDAPRRVALADGRLPPLPGVERTVPVRHQDELLGALAVVKPRGERLTPIEDKLVTDLAFQAGLVLRNLGLTAELLARLEDLRLSRQRLISAQDEERRRLERNLHDGAQQHLVALKVKLGLVAREAEATALKQTLVAVQSDADEAIEALRELARGIYPPLLADEGLAAALDAHVRRSPVAVTVEAVGLTRYAPDVEAAVYFCCLEALQNIAKHAAATSAVVRLTETDGELCFAVEDDGVGFDPAATLRGSGLQNMADRLEALGGRIEVASSPRGGTTIAGRVPVDAPLAAQRGDSGAPRA